MRSGRTPSVLLAVLAFERALGCHAEEVHVRPTRSEPGRDRAEAGSGGEGSWGHESGEAGAQSTSTGVSGAGSGGEGGDGACGRSGNAGAAGDEGGAGQAGEARADGFDGECPLRYSEGHGDLFVAFDGALSIELRSAFFPSQPEKLEEPESVCIIVGGASRALAESYGGAPEGREYAFLGVPPGASFWLLPAIPQEGIPWFGASTEQVPRGRYTNEELRLVLALERGPANGNVAVWSTSVLGEPTILYSTAEGVLVQRFAVGAHVHFNWSFAVAGDYRLEFRAEGTRIRDGESEASPVAKFRFLVGP